MDGSPAPLVLAQVGIDRRLPVLLAPAHEGEQDGRQIVRLDLRQKSLGLLDQSLHALEAGGVDAAPDRGQGDRHVAAMREQREQLGHGGGKGDHHEREPDAEADPFHLASPSSPLVDGIPSAPSAMM